MLRGALQLDEPDRYRYVGPMNAQAALRALFLMLSLAAATVGACAGDSDPDEEQDDDDDDDDGSSTTTSTTGGGTTDATLEDACQGIANRYEVCYEDPDYDVATCSAANACFSAIYRDDAEQPMLDCFAGWGQNPDCDGEYCSDQIAPSLTPTPEHTAHEASCAAYETDCGQSAGDVCRNPVVQLEPALVAIITNCIDGQCGALEACLDQAVGDYLAPCGGDARGLW